MEERSGKANRKEEDKIKLIGLRFERRDFVGL